ncbi:MAG: hypothetical protein Q9169_001838 [Polycauliona sp. 2 TL-2023]
MTLEKGNIEVCEEEATASSENYVEICPHEKLTFPRLQKIVNLPGFKDSYLGINGLTLSCEEHYSVTQHDNAYQCVIGSADRHSHSHGCGDIKLHYAKVYRPSEYTGPHPGVLLESKWTIWLDQFPKEICTSDGVARFWAERPIFLCPHKGLIDFVGPQRFLDAVDAVQAHERNKDPIRDYESEHLIKGKEECSVRLLGKANSPKDSIWLCQCAGGSNVAKGRMDGFTSLSTALSTVRTAFDRVILP